LLQKCVGLLEYLERLLKFGSWFHAVNHLLHSGSVFLQQGSSRFKSGALISTVLLRSIACETRARSQFAASSSSSACRMRSAVTTRWCVL
jgi:hypothetical protein